MQVGRITGSTRTLGKEQGYIGLPVRDETDPDGSNWQMTSAWFPSPEELLALAKGAPLYLTVFGNVHPPVKLSVGEIPKED